MDNNLCRICLCSPNLLIPIFDDTQLSDKIRLISSVVIKENDGFPNGICVDCITKVDLCYNFKLVVINSDVELKIRAMKNVIKISKDTLQRISREMIQEKEQGGSSLKQSGDGDKTEVVKEIVTTVQEPDKPQAFVWNNKMIENRNFNRKIRGCTNKCDVCEKVFNNPESLRQHQCGKHGSKICEVCGELVSHKSMYQHHLKKYHEGVPKPSSCSFCLEIFVNEKNLKAHHKMHKRTTICGVCKKVFPTSAALKMHKRQHIKCALCSAVFNSKPALQLHIIKKHPESGNY